MPTYPWKWSNDRIIEELIVRQAMMAMSGRTCPVTKLVLARMGVSP